MLPPDIPRTEAPTTIPNEISPVPARYPPNRTALSKGTGGKKTFKKEKAKNNVKRIYGFSAQRPISLISCNVMPPLARYHPFIVFQLFSFNSGVQSNYFL
jgi:hypothetical protein